jgi:hypothetical protein
MAALRSLGDSAGHKDHAPDPEAKAKSLAMFDEALRFLRGGIEALQER